VERAFGAFDRANVSPLGAGALAGTSFPLDPSAAAEELGFDRAFANSIDAVSDRDFAAEAAFVASLAGVHLSQLAEELVLWSTPQFGFVELPEEYTTGSSIMPQKRNPDAAELVRGRAGRATGDLVNLLTTLKGLPSAYNRDLQETKAPLMRALPATAESARILAAVARGLKPKPQAIWAALEKGHLAATELADYVTARGVPFREAHHVVGRLVKEADARNIQLKDFSLDELRRHWPGFESDVHLVLDPVHVPDRKITAGGTAPERVREAVEVGLADLKVKRAAFDLRVAKVARARALLEA
jgi:argininosuccinate lyase